MIKWILPDKSFGKGTQDRFMNTQNERALFIQVFIEKIKHPVLQFVIKIYDYISANDQIEFNQKEIWIFHQVQFLIHRF